MVNQLIQDNAFKADFYSLLLENRRKATPSQVNNAWAGACKAMFDLERDAHQRRVAFDLESMKSVVLQSAEVGLSLAKNDKESYIGMSYESLGEYRLGFAYRGLRRMMLSNPEVKMICSAVIFEGDKFEWRGNSEKPLIVSDSRGSVVIGAFGWLSQKDGDIYSVLLTEEDLYSAETRDIQRAVAIYGDENQSIYRSPWRKRMFEIEAIKALYRHCSDVLDLTTDFGDVFANASTVGQLD